MARKRKTDNTEPQADHHYYATTSLWWAVGETREDAIRKAMQSTRHNGVKQSPMYVWSVRVELPRSARYDIENYSPVNVPLKRAIDGEYAIVKGALMAKAEYQHEHDDKNAETYIKKSEWATAARKSLDDNAGKTKGASTYEFQPYDVIQVLRGDKWLDFSTLRTNDDARRAVAMVDTGRFDGETLAFRIRRGFNEIVYQK